MSKLPGPPGTCTVTGTRVEALGLAAVAQISNVRRDVRTAAESAGREVALTVANQIAVAAGMADRSAVQQWSVRGRELKGQQEKRLWWWRCMEVPGGQQEGALGIVAGEVPQSGGLLPPWQRTGQR